MDYSWITAAFTAVNAVRVVFYIPQIIAVARSQDGARDIALSTWLMWTLTNGLGSAYGACAVRDSALAASFALSFVACSLTIALTVHRRMALKQRRQAERSC